MVLQNILIRGRDRLLDRLLGIDGSRVLNPDPPESRITLDASELAADIKTAINRFKATAMDSTGKLVDYARLQASEAYQHAYRDCVARLHYLDLSNLKPYPDGLAFWINLYNSLTVDAVIQFEVSKSVTEGRLGILSFFEKAAYQIGDQRYSLTDIEHGILRANRGFPYFIGPHFGPNDPRRRWILAPFDPRIHFALNCASQSCPPIGIYSPDRIEPQLDLAARNFSDANIRVDFDRGVVSLSSIFRWYQADFGGRAGVVDFLIRHLPDDARRTWLLKSRRPVRFEYQPYDWDLNKNKFTDKH